MLQNNNNNRHGVRFLIFKKKSLTIFALFQLFIVNIYNNYKKVILSEIKFVWNNNIQEAGKRVLQKKNKQKLLLHIF